MTLDEVKKDWKNEKKNLRNETKQEKTQIKRLENSRKSRMKMREFTWESYLYLAKC